MFAQLESFMNYWHTVHSLMHLVLFVFFQHLKRHLDASQPITSEVSVETLLRNISKSVNVDEPYTDYKCFEETGCTLSLSM